MAHLGSCALGQPGGLKLPTEERGLCVLGIRGLIVTLVAEGDTALPCRAQGMLARGS